MDPENPTSDENNFEIEPYNPADDPEEDFAIFAEYGDDY